MQQIHFCRAIFHGKTGHLLFAVLALLVSLFAYPAIADFYTIEDLGTLPGDDISIANGINDTGQVVGASIGTLGSRSFIFIDGKGMQELPSLSGRPLSQARDINKNGDAAGSAWTQPSDMPGHAVRWKSGMVQDLGTLGFGFFSEAYGINDSGQVAGYSYVNGAFLPVHAFLFTDEQGLIDITPNASLAYGFDLNNFGQVTGYADGRAFRWTNGSLLDLGVLPDFATSYGAAINDMGQVAGTLISPSGNIERLFRYTDGIGMVNLGGFGSFNRVYGMNNNGDFVGRGLPALNNAFEVGFLYSGKTGLLDVNKLIDPALGWLILGANDINNLGQIVGYAFNNNTKATHAVRLSPPGIVPPPGPEPPPVPEPPPAQDTMAPSVSIVTPQDGALVSGLVTIKATAADNVGVALLEIYIDGALKASGTTENLSTKWNTKKAKGLHVIKALARDAAGNQGVKEIKITVN